VTNPVAPSTTTSRTRSITTVLFLCTGNATRSVLAGELLRVHRPDLAVETAGTLSVGGRPISWRTRRAFEAIGLEPPRHASVQADDEHLAAADLIVGLAPEHVRWVRREHPDHADRTATLLRLDRTAGPLRDWIASGSPGGVELADWEEVVDPGGGEVEAFVACAHEIAGIVRRVAPRL
jgi:protein-tyrosine-phosphatase